ncbi:amidohydrolase family protein, partial [Acidithiobacillus ferrooxidans]|nr:amidohydrolase family protein [Acidithiobacillus ferrooxidans]
MRLLIRNARIALPSGELYHGDLFSEEGRIVAIDRDIDRTADTVIDAEGHMLMPGVMDPQVHFREPGNEQKEDISSGSRAAAKGGVTSFLEMPNTNPATTSPAALADKLARGAEKSVVNYGFFIGATPDNLDSLLAADAACGIKIFMGASTGNLLVDKEEDLDRIFAHGRKLIAVHAEDEARIRERRAQFSGSCEPADHSRIRDEESALMATRRAVRLSKKYQRRLHILHLSTAVETEFLRREKTPYISCEAI